MPLAVCIALVLGQTSSQPAAEAEILGTEYVDGSAAFAIRPPAGWQLARSRIVGESETTLLRMIGPAALGLPQEVLVKQLDSPRARRMNDVVKDRVHALSLEYSGLTVHAQQLQDISERPGGFIAATFEQEGSQWLRLEGLVESRLGGVLLVQYTGPVEARAASEPTFHRVLGSFRLLSLHLDGPALKRALDAGTAWLDRLGERELRQAIVAEHSLRLRVEGKPIGFMRVTEAQVEWKRRPAIRIKERGWVFHEGNLAQRIQRNLHLSMDRETEQWETSETTLRPVPASVQRSLDVLLESGLRTRDVLLSSQTYGLGQPATENPALRLPRTYLPRVLARMLPRLMRDLSRPQTLAFTAFDHHRADLVVRVVELKGESRLPSGSSAGRVYRIDERDGLAAEASNIYVDENGRLLFVTAGSLQMEPADMAALEPEFASRIETAEREMNHLEKEYREAEGRFGRGEAPP